MNNNFVLYAGLVLLVPVVIVVGLRAVGLILEFIDSRRSPKGGSE